MRICFDKTSAPEKIIEPFKSFFMRKVWALLLLKCYLGRVESFLYTSLLKPFYVFSVGKHNLAIMQTWDSCRYVKIFTIIFLFRTLIDLLKLRWDFFPWTSFLWSFFYLDILEDGKCFYAQFLLDILSSENHAKKQKSHKVKMNCGLVIVLVET